MALSRIDKFSGCHALEVGKSLRSRGNEGGHGPQNCTEVPRSASFPASCGLATRLADA